MAHVILERGDLLKVELSDGKHRRKCEFHDREPSIIVADTDGKRFAIIPDVA